ncbi:protein kinase [Streptomyces sp. SID10853]|uniref:serine/threonine-protein kinase n=1 Tax=Streptomyces sp. SID10853 TaxID=2706028 RepID=UPI0013BFF26E|nr:serine/threonine-protein kinase [Streptomyces sp. SID10853]NDZ77036.1 protein kinase [Streptomyces sp. SID10853]
MGEVFAGRYELVDPIGRGGVGAVWRAWDHRRRRYVAAKVLQQSDAHTLLRFVREQALRIDHPHVLAPASWAADDDQVLFTMELVSGGSLVQVVGEYGPLPPRFVCTLLDQLLAGLAAVHAEGVVHRDIKPANILMEATGTGRPHLRLSDFGISMRKGEPRLTESNYVVGTPGYFAPEQMLGAEPDFTADLFAVGLVALYLLQGARPDSRALVEHFAAHGTPGAPRGIPEPLWQVLAGLLQPDPQARFRTANGARKALATAVELLPEPGPGEQPVEVRDQIGPLPGGFGPEGPVSQQGPVSQPPVQQAMTQPGMPAHPAHPQTEQQPVPHPQQPQHPAMSETGSFHLAPPPQPTAPAPAPTAAAAPTVSHPASPVHAQTPAQIPAQLPGQALYEQPHTDRYTAQPSQVPTQSVPVPRTRPGPPPKVTVPVLVIALICFAVGIWALTQS